MDAKDLHLVCLQESHFVCGDNLRYEAELAIGCRVTIAPDMETLLDYLETLPVPPHAIAIYDDSRPATQSRLGSLFNTVASSKARNSEDMPGVKALKILKAEESFYKNIPVIVYNVFDSEPFLQAGADGAVSSGAYCETKTLFETVADVAGIQNLVRSEPDFEQRPVEIIKSKSEEEFAFVPLEGDQIAQFQNELARQALQLSTPEGIDKVSKTPGFVKWERGLKAELEKRGNLNVANICSTLLHRMAELTTERGITTKDETIALIDEVVREAGEPEGRLVHLILLLAGGESMSRALGAVRGTDILGNLSREGQLMFASSVQKWLAWFDHTGKLGIAEAAESQQFLDEFKMSDSAMDYIASLNERQIAREAADILRSFRDSLEGNMPSSAQFILSRFENMFTAQDQENINAAKYAVTQSLEEAQFSAPGKGEILSRKQIEKAIAFIDERMTEGELSDKSKALLRKTCGYLISGMRIEDVCGVVRTLSAFEQFGGTGSWAERNALREMKKAFALVSNVRLNSRPAGPQPG